MAKVEIYTTNTCPFCRMAKQLFEAKNVVFQEIDVSGDAPGRQAMTVRAAGRTSVPQIWIGSNHVGGCDDLYALERAGKLDALLQSPA